MLKKKLGNLLTSFSKREVQTLFDTARTIFRHKGLEIRITPKTLEYGRILIIIPRHVGSAVQRNLLRRRLKNIFYQNHLYQTGYDYIVLAKKSATTLSFSQIKELLITRHEPAQNS